MFFAGAIVSQPRTAASVFAAVAAFRRTGVPTPRVETQAN
jgi:hypothetical protein